MRNGTLSLLLLTLAACSPAQRATVGAGIGAAGLGVTYGALVLMVPSCRVHRERDQVCVEYSDGLPPNVGFPLAFGGLGTVVLGGLILGTATQQGELPPASMPALPAPPDKVAALHVTEAVGMAIAQLLLAGVSGDAKPPRLLGVDDTQSTLHVQGRHAELWNLRIRTAADVTWRSVGACYEYEHEWHLTLLRTTSGCSR